MNLEIDNVLWRLREKIISIPDKKFIEILNSIKNELMKKDTNLKERVKKVWSEVENNSLDFRRKESLLEEIDLINKSDILKGFDEIFIDDPKKMSIQIYASNLYINQENEEVYYLNANLNYHVTSDFSVLDNLDE
jgi:secreted Zn-dependent insulinase-like peptidase